MTRYLNVPTPHRSRLLLTLSFAWFFGIEAFWERVGGRRVGFLFAVGPVGIHATWLDRTFPDDAPDDDCPRWLAALSWLAWMVPIGLLIFAICLLTNPGGLPR